MNAEIHMYGAQGTMGSALYSRCLDAGVSAVALTRETEIYDEAVRIGNIHMLCMKQHDVVDWLNEHGSSLKKDAIVLSLAAFVSLESLQKHCANPEVQVARFMTTTNVRYGADEIVWTSAGGMSEKAKIEIQGVLEKISTTRYLGEYKDAKINEKTYRACAVGFLADELDKSVEGLVTIGMSREDAQEAIDNALYVVAMQRQKQLSFRQILEAVMSKGGLTEYGILARAKTLFDAISSCMQAMVTRGAQIGDLYSYKKGA